jgi:hypothetical protein
MKIGEYYKVDCIFGHQYIMEITSEVYATPIHIVSMNKEWALWKSVWLIESIQPQEHSNVISCVQMSNEDLVQYFLEV